MKVIGIIGCGWLGSKLAHRLSGEFKINASTRTPERANKLALLGYSSIAVEFSDKKEVPMDRWDVIPSLDILVVLVPFSIRRATPESLRVKMNNLCKFIGDYSGQLFFASSTGVYPRNRKTFSEEDLRIEDNLTENQIKRSYPRANILRLAGLMGDNRLLSKYQVTHLEDPVNHVHYEDVCSVIARMIQHQMHERLYNVVAPLHPTKREVIQAQLRNSQDKALGTRGRIISSSKLIAELGFEFKYPDPRKFHEPLSV